MKKPVLSIKGLVTERGEHFSLHIPNLQLYPGRTLCLTGPNGSGKTTLTENLVGLLPSTSGVVEVLAAPITNNVSVVRRHIGYIPDDEDWLVKELSAREYIDLLARIYREAGIMHDSRERSQVLADTLSFAAFDTPLRQLSHGNKKKVQIIAALMHQPDLIIVDELRNGLDPLAIVAAERLVAGEAKRGACIVAATHDLWWAERVADEVLLLAQGKIVFHRTVPDIQHEFGSVEHAFTRTVTGAKK